MSRTFNNFILLTLGTGVGGAIFIDGKLFTGVYGAAGELGLITLYPEGYACNSGNRGSLEQYCSITAIIRETGQEPVLLGKLAENGDQKAIAFRRNLHLYSIYMSKLKMSCKKLLCPYFESWIVLRELLAWVPGLSKLL